jgi:hypothetical protein
MTDMDTTVEDIIAEALVIIDQGLAQLLHRELVSATEAADVLLDVRSILAAAGELEPASEPVGIAN